MLQRNNQPLAAATVGRPTNDQVTGVSAIFILTRVADPHSFHPDPKF